MNSTHLAIIAILGLATVVGFWRAVRDARTWRWTRAIGQFVMAGSLYFLLVPPDVELRRISGVVLTSGVTPEQLSNRDQTLLTLALPGVVIGDSRIDIVPDLASGLRQHPEIGDIEILGDGLQPRDRDAVGDLGLRFSAGEDPPGVTDLQLPGEVGAGEMWSVRGRLSGMPGAHVRLLDRRDAIVASVAPDDEGRFVLSARAKTASQSVYRMQVVDAAEAPLEEISVPLAVANGDAVSTLILAGAPDAELKYLRRWIVDSGNSVASRIGLSRGIEQRQNTIDLTSSSLEETDLLIADERAWSSLTKAEKAQIKTSVEQGMGLILRIVGPLSSQVRAEWGEIGFRIESSDVSRSVTVASPVSGVSLSRQSLTVSAEDSVALAMGEDGSTLSVWRSIGQGRIALWLPLDSYRLQLQGDESHYGALWSEVFKRIARARGVDKPDLPKSARVGLRSVVCGLKAAAAIEDAEGNRHDLLTQKRAASCAAWWPLQSGWHTLIDGESRWPLYVSSADDAKSLMRVETRESTSRLVHGSAISTHRAAMQRWPLFLIWLALSALCWWLERRAVYQSAAKL